MNPLKDVCRANMSSVAWGLATAYGLLTASTGGGPVASGFKAWKERKERETIEKVDKGSAKLNEPEIKCLPADPATSP